MKPPLKISGRAFHTRVNACDMAISAGYWSYTAASRFRMADDLGPYPYLALPNLLFAVLLDFGAIDEGS
jgi:hypothetical protein